MSSLRRVIRAKHPRHPRQVFGLAFGLAERRLPNAECRSSLIPQRLHRFNPGSTIGRNDAGQQSYAEKADGHCKEGK